MRNIFIFFIRVYQKIPGSFHNKCRYIPTCSEYAIESLRRYGTVKGIMLSVKRIFRCNPFGGYGYDPVPYIKKRSEKMKKFLLLVTLFMGCLFITGCKQDEMDDINIIVTNYPNEFVTKKLYGAHANITSVYPDGVDINNYKINSKQKHEFSKKDLFIYNGLIKEESQLAFDLLDLNQNLKIIDTAYVLDTDYSKEELWLNPSTLLRMAQNVRLGLEEYISSAYIEREIDEAYEKLKIELSELDADYRVSVENTNNKTIVVGNASLKFLEKFGLNVICIDDDTSDKEINNALNLMQSGNISYIYLFKDDKVNDTLKKVLDEHSNIKTVEFHKLDNLSDGDRSSKKNYLTIMNENLELLKQELYQ